MQTKYIANFPNNEVITDFKKFYNHFSNPKSACPDIEIGYVLEYSENLCIKNIVKNWFNTKSACPDIEIGFLLDKSIEFVIDNFAPKELDTDLKFVFAFILLNEPIDFIRIHWALYYEITKNNYSEPKEDDCFAAIELLKEINLIGEL